MIAAMGVGRVNRLDESESVFMGCH
jgi:hypothetical protein